MYSNPTQKEVIFLGVIAQVLLGIEKDLSLSWEVLGGTEKDLGVSKEISRVPEVPNALRVGQDGQTLPTGDYVLV